MKSVATKPSLLIVWHSRTGASEALARAAAKGAQSEITVKMCSAPIATIEDVLQAHAYLFVCPENLASMSGAMKEFFDRTYYAALGKIEGRAYATIIAAGSDGSGAQQQIDRITTGWRLRRVIDPYVQDFAAQDAQSIWAPKSINKDSEKQARKIGLTLGTGVSLGLF